MFCLILNLLNPVNLFQADCFPFQMFIYYLIGDLRQTQTYFTSTTTVCIAIRGNPSVPMEDIHGHPQVSTTNIKSEKRLFVQIVKEGEWSYSVKPHLVKMLTRMRWQINKHLSTVITSLQPKGTKGWFYEVAVKLRLSTTRSNSESCNVTKAEESRSCFTLGLNCILIQLGSHYIGCFILSVTHTTAASAMKGYKFWNPWLYSRRGDVCS